jgi:hypothetical protein
MKRETFTIQHDDFTPADCPRTIPWELIEPHEPQALRNHEQSLERLNERKGLDAMEAVAVLENKGYWARWPYNSRERPGMMKEATEILKRLLK